MKISYHRLKNRIKDTLLKVKARRDRPHTTDFQSIKEALSRLSDQEKDALQQEIRQHLSKSGETIEYAQRIFNIYSRDYLQYSATLDSISILEIGPGTNLAAGLYFLLAGAAHFTGIDALAAFPERPVEFYRNAVDQARENPALVGRKSLSDSDVDRILQLNSSCRWNAERLRYLTPVFADAVPLPDNSFDYIFSNASFEHFENPGGVIKEVYRLLKPGGLTVHTIDLRDHNDFTKPREFLKIPASDYSFTSPYGTNRWRSSDFTQSFKEAGFELKKVEITEQAAVTESEFSLLDAFFTNRYSRSDLEILGIKIYAVK